MPPGVARDALVDQAGAARRNLQNLGDRRIELASFGPLDRLKARLGFGTLDVRLEQPPRLFIKTACGDEEDRKGRSAAHPDKAQFGESPRAHARRRTLGDKERSPQIDQEGVVEVKRVGPEWREHSGTRRGQDRRSTPVTGIAASKSRRPTAPRRSSTRRSSGIRGLPGGFDGERTRAKRERSPRKRRSPSRAARSKDAPKGVTIKTLGERSSNRRVATGSTRCTSSSMPTER